MIELGIYTFGDLVADPKTGRAVSAQVRMHQMLELAKLADSLGLDVIGVGEHHSRGFVNSATATIIAAMATVTRNIRLTSACTLLSTADPVRTYQEFATADLASDGRVEVIFGRGAFTESFPLFGFSLDDYDALFLEKLQLFEQINAAERVTWSGKYRPALKNAEVAPRPAQAALPVWIGAGSPNSVARAAYLGYPLAIPMVGGSLANYARVAKVYHQVWRETHGDRPTRVSTFAHCHVAADSQDLHREFYPYYSAYLAPLYRGQPMPVAAFDQMVGPDGGLVAGSPQQVIDKIMTHHQAMGSTRFLGQIDIGGQPFEMITESVERFATQVAPVLRAELH